MQNIYRIELAGHSGYSKKEIIFEVSSSFAFLTPDTVVPMGLEIVEDLAPKEVDEMGNESNGIVVAASPGSDQLEIKNDDSKALPLCTPKVKSDKPYGRSVLNTYSTPLTDLLVEGLGDVGGGSRGCWRREFSERRTDISSCYL
jgi:hypothetical protein